MNFLKFIVPIILYVFGFQILQDDTWRELVASALFIIGASISYLKFEN